MIHRVPALVFAALLVACAREDALTVGAGRGAFCGGLEISVDEAALLADADRDGFRVCEGDCADGDPLAHPAAPEPCDGLDSDCDGVAELDGDGDGSFGCEDCADDDPARYPSALESCDGLDSNCDGVAELDGDGDGSFDCEDCAPADPAIGPSRAEVPANGVDDNCDGYVDVPRCGVHDPTTMEGLWLTDFQQPISVHLPGPSPAPWPEPGASGVALRGGLMALRLGTNEDGRMAILQEEVADAFNGWYSKEGNIRGVVQAGDGTPVLISSVRLGSSSGGSHATAAWMAADGYHETTLQGCFPESEAAIPWRLRVSVGRPRGGDSPAELLLTTTGDELFWLRIDDVLEDPDRAVCTVTPLASPDDGGGTGLHIDAIQGECDVDGDGRSDAIAHRGMADSFVPAPFDMVVYRSSTVESGSAPPPERWLFPERVCGVIAPGHQQEWLLCPGGMTVGPGDPRQAVMAWGGESPGSQCDEGLLLDFSEAPTTVTEAPELATTSPVIRELGAYPVPESDGPSGHCPESSEFYFCDSGDINGDGVSEMVQSDYGMVRLWDGATFLDSGVPLDERWIGGWAISGGVALCPAQGVPSDFAQIWIWGGTADSSSEFLNRAWPPVVVEEGG